MSPFGDDFGSVRPSAGGQRARSSSQKYRDRAVFNRRAETAAFVRAPLKTLVSGSSRALEPEAMAHRAVLPGEASGRNGARSAALRGGYNDAGEQDLEDFERHKKNGAN